VIVYKTFVPVKKNLKVHSLKIKTAHPWGRCFWPCVCPAVDLCASNEARTPLHCGGKD